jgi:hypothetical protein
MVSPAAVRRLDSLAAVSVLDPAQSATSTRGSPPIASRELRRRVDCAGGRPPTPLPSDAEPQEDEAGKHQQRLEHDVFSRLRDVMEPKEPVDPHDIEAQDDARSCQHTEENDREHVRLLQTRNPTSTVIATATTESRATIVSTGNMIHPR